ncbi:hypothetical protein M5689_017669 [Euphorbia peplus]|nr:hypothetical protein M5689_017669 [Euphorbia peplus]
MDGCYIDSFRPRGSRYYDFGSAKDDHVVYEEECPWMPSYYFSETPAPRPMTRLQFLPHNLDMTYDDDDINNNEDDMPDQSYSRRRKPESKCFFKFFKFILCIS